MNNIQQKMVWKKSTSGTEVFEAVEDDTGLPPAIRTLYIAKFKARGVKSIEVTVKVDTAG